jgi:hypothetical protein
MGNITDMDDLFPEEEVVSFSINKKKYDVKVFIPAAVGFLIIDNIDVLKDIFPGGHQPKLSRKAVDLAMKILSTVISEQHPDITEQMIREQLSLTKQVFLLYKLVVPVYEFLTNSGFLEAAMPVKTPETQKTE